jgi:hypothetical protein
MKRSRLTSGTLAHLSAPGYAERAVSARSAAPDRLPLVGEDKQGMEPSVRIHTPILLPFAPISFVFALVFLHNLQPLSTAIAAELPPSRFKMTGSLAILRWLMGWQAPGLACKVRSGATSLANMRPGDFVFFVAYALAGLVPPLSSFFLTLLEYYGL